jgi:hypothetical protein
MITHSMRLIYYWPCELMNSGLDLCEMSCSLGGGGCWRKPGGGSGVNPPNSAPMGICPWSIGPPVIRALHEYLMWWYMDVVPAWNGWQESRVLPSIFLSEGASNSYVKKTFCLKVVSGNRLLQLTGYALRIDRHGIFTGSVKYVLWNLYSFWKILKGSDEGV